MPVDVGTSEAARPFEGYDSPIETLSLSVRAYNCLKRSGLTTIGAVLEKSEEELLALRNFGEKSYEELRDKLVAHGYPTPRVDTRRPTNGTEPMAPAPAATAARGSLPELDEEGVGALGAALMEALRESGRRPE
jgi:DNA-directed RNA polymerase subunit alpha